MKRSISDMAFTRSVKVVQERLGSRKQYARSEHRGGWQDLITPELAAFISERDFFYLGTAGPIPDLEEDHRASSRCWTITPWRSPISPAVASTSRSGIWRKTIRRSFSLMDYANRHPIKVWGTAEVIEDDPAFLAQLSEPGYHGRPERAICFHVEAWDPNCRQHIQPRYTKEEIASTVGALEDRIRQLVAENVALKNQLSESIDQAAV